LPAFLENCHKPQENAVDNAGYFRRAALNRPANLLAQFLDERSWKAGCALVEFIRVVGRVKYYARSSFSTTVIPLDKASRAT